MAGDIYNDTSYFKNLYVTFVHFIQPNRYVDEQKNDQMKNNFSWIEKKLVQFVLHCKKFLVTMFLC